MKKIVNECVGCPPEIGCFGSLCPKRNVVHYYCDRCGKEVEEEKLYEHYEEEICEECLLEEFGVAEIDEDFFGVTEDLW